MREAVGNRLQSMGVLLDARVVDLFAGTGALGIEALSRGAAHVTFVDNGSAALDAINTNLETIGFTDRATVVRSDASRFGGGPFDIAFIDPTNVDHDAMGQALKKAIYNFMHGIGLDSDVRSWFDVRVPKPTVPRQKIAKALAATTAP